MNKAGKIACITAGAAVGAAGLYVLSLRGRRDHASWETLKKYRYAHRGYHQKPEIPENSLPAFRRAVERNWGAELDVHLLKDGTLMVSHDSDLKRCTGAEGILEELTLAEAKELRLEGTQEQMPTFDEVLEIFEGKTPLIIELKTWNGNHRALAQAVLERLDSYAGDFCVESFDPYAIMDVRDLRPDVCRGQLAMNFFKGKNQPLPKALLGTSLALNALAKPDFVAYRFADRKDLPVQLATKLWGVQEVSWTVRSREDMEALEKEGCLIIFENFDPEEE